MPPPPLGFSFAGNSYVHGCSSLDVLHPFLILMLIFDFSTTNGSTRGLPKILFKFQPALEEPFGLLRLETHGGDPIEESTNAIHLTGFDFEIDQDVPKIETFRPGGEETFEEGSASLGVAVDRSKFELGEFGGHLEMGVRREGLSGSCKERPGSVGCVDRAHEESGVVNPESRGLREPFDDGLEECVGLLQM